MSEMCRMRATVVGKVEYTVPKVKVISAIRVHMKDIKCVYVIKTCEYRESLRSCAGIAGTHHRHPGRH